MNFDHQNDLGPALTGRRLGPSEVKACPRLPEVETVRRLLTTAHSAILVGESGSGKSITAYQVAYDLCQQGWEILRLKDPLQSPGELVSVLSKLPCPTVVIIDDAQTLEQATLRRLIERASPALAILIVSAADSSVQRGNIFIAKERAVDTLAETFAQRRDEILAIVHQLDDHVGEGYTDTWLEDRLREAAKTEFPWQFAFVLTGGWRRAQDELAALRERDRADLLLAAVAAV